jgi:methyl coenzyme M reductase subunit C
MTEKQQPEWVDLDPEKQGVIIDYITQLLTGRSIPDTPEGEVIRRIIAVVRDDKKTLKYA